LNILKLLNDALCNFYSQLNFIKHTFAQILNMKEFIRKNSFLIIFSAAGAAGGFLYWKYVGCQSGTCPIKSVWYLSTLWGLAFGYLSGSIIRDLLVKIRDKRTAKGNNDPNQDQENI
jgi:hypothetical protein